jgi:hypothetical protein
MADQTPGAEATAAGNGIFPELLAGLVAANGAAAGDRRAASSATPLDAAPRFDTAAGIETLLTAILAAPHGEAAALVEAAAAAPAAKWAPAVRPAARRAGSREPSGTAPKLTAGAGKPEPAPVQLAERQTNSAIQMRPALTIVATPARPPAEPFLMPATDGERAPTSSAQSPAANQAADGQVPCAPGKTPAVELEVKLGSPGLRAAAGVQPNGQTSGAAANRAILDVVAVGEPALPPETARGGHPPNAPMARPAATGNPAGTEVDGAPASRLPAARVAPQPGAKLSILAKNPAAAGIELSPQPAVPAAAQPGARTSIAVAGTPPGTVPAPVEPADELPGVQPKPFDPMPAQAALAPAQPDTPPATRPRSGDPDDAAPADEMMVRAGLPAPPPAAGPADFSGRLATRTPAATPPSRRSSSSVVAQVLALSGQVPRTVDSIPTAAPAPLPAPVFRPADLLPAGSRPALEPPAPTVPAEAAPLSPDESLIPGADTQVRVLGTGTPDRDEVAFALQVKAMPTPEGTAQDAPPAGLPAAKGSQRIPMPAQQGGVPVPDPVAASQKRASLPDEPDQTPARAGRERHLDAASLEHPGPGAGATAGKMNPQASPDAQVRTETATGRSQATQAAEAKPVRPQDVQEVMDGAAKPEAVKGPAVHDMKFEVTGGQQRVEVRLSERAGEVKMTVRTADEPLANTLRENLPALSARLAESGFKSEAWHPAASSTNELRHTAESGARGASHDTNQDADAQPRQQDRQAPDGAAQRRPKSPQEVAPQKEKGKDFSWLMSSLR